MISRRGSSELKLMTFIGDEDTPYPQQNRGHRPTSHSVLTCSVSTQNDGEWAIDRYTHTHIPHTHTHTHTHMHTHTHLFFCWHRTPLVWHVCMPQHRQKHNTDSHRRLAWTEEQWTEPLMYCTTHTHTHAYTPHTHTHTHHRDLSDKGPNRPVTATEDTSFRYTNTGARPRRFSLPLRYMTDMTMPPALTRAALMGPLLAQALRFACCEDNIPFRSELHSFFCTSKSGETFQEVRAQGEEVDLGLGHSSP